ncbi:MAG: hypothetical protein LBR22_08160 [Desulfovibrio sp.]|jgi:hypothetical protein|nr:hypothetical protein [Desulfovibrio sp.]
MQEGSVKADFSALYGNAPPMPLLGGADINGSEGRMGLAALHGTRIGTCSYHNAAMTCKSDAHGTEKILRDVGIALPRLLARPGISSSGLWSAEWTDAENVRYTYKGTTITFIFSRIDSQRPDVTPHPAPHQETP